MQDESSRNTGQTCDGTTTCEPSRLNPSKNGKSMSSAAGSRAKILATPEKGPGSQESEADCSTNWPGSFGFWDQESLSWKTSQRCLLGGLMPFSGRWPRSGTMRSGNVYQRRPLVPRISGTEYLFWPTPRANDAEKRGNVANNKRNGLVSAAKYWPTPRASEVVNGKNIRGGLGLTSTVLKEEGIDGKLNPNWVEWLMGFPIGHTDLEDSETQ